MGAAQGLWLRPWGICMSATFASLWVWERYDPALPPEDYTEPHGTKQVLTFIRATPPMQKVKQLLVRTLLRRYEYVPRTSPDRMVTSAVLLLELPLILGLHLIGSQLL